VGRKFDLFSPVVINQFIALQIETGNWSACICSTWDFIFSFLLFQLSHLKQKCIQLLQQCKMFTNIYSKTGATVLLYGLLPCSYLNCFVYSFKNIKSIGFMFYCLYCSNYVGYVTVRVPLITIALIWIWIQGSFICTLQENILLFFSFFRTICKLMFVHRKRADGCAVWATF
jgi:hypothetical protein